MISTDETATEPRPPEGPAEAPAPAVDEFDLAPPAEPEAGAVGEDAGPSEAELAEALARSEAEAKAEAALAEKREARRQDCELNEALADLQAAREQILSRGKAWGEADRLASKLAARGIVARVIVAGLGGENMAAVMVLTPAQAAALPGGF